MEMKVPLTIESRNTAVWNSIWANMAHLLSAPHTLTPLMCDELSQRAVNCGEDEFFILEPWNAGASAGRRTEW